MKLVNSYGGHSICVYNSQLSNMNNVIKLFNENRIKYFAPADYNENSKLDLLIKTIIDKTVAFEKLNQYYLNDKKILITNKKEVICLFLYYSILSSFFNHYSYIK